MTINCARPTTAIARQRAVAVLAFLLFAIVLLASHANAATYYVRTDGSDSNTGTGSDTASAWQTINHAVTSSLTAGDVIYVQAGDYVEKLDVKIQGTSASPIQIIADRRGSITGWEPGEVTIDASSEGEAIKIDNQDYVEFHGFRIRGKSGDNGFLLKDSTGLIFNKCELYDAGVGVYIENATIQLINTLIRDNSGDGIQTNAGNVTAWNCTIVNNGGDGIDIGNDWGTVVNTIIASNGGFGITRQSDGDGTLFHIYNLLYGNTSGPYAGTVPSVGDVFADPQFVSSSDYHLRSTSPAKDAGVASTGSVDDDFHSNPRPHNGTWDIGYHEHESTAGTTPLLLVAQNDGYLTTQERYRKTLFEAWDYSVTIIWDADTQANYDSALASVDVVYISEEAFSDDLGYKLRETTVGIVNDEPCLTDEFGFSSECMTNVGTFSAINISDNTHYITSPFSTGSLTILDAAQDSYYFSGVVAAGATILGDWGGSNSLAILDVDDTLQNTYNGSNVALGRRVQIGWGGNFDFSSLNSDGRTLIQRALEWAAADPSSLVGHWKFDEGTGSTAADSSNNANDATISGATWTSDCTSNTALAFDGAGDVATTDSNFDPPATGTVAFWMRGAGTPPVRHRLFGVDANWEARMETNGTISFDLGASAFAGNEPFATTAVDEENRWYHIAAVFNYTTDSYNVYVDGISVASGTSPVDLVAQPAGILSFGTRTGSTEYWEGAFREFRVYNRELTGSEVAELAGMVGYWKLDETSGSTAADSGGNGYNGTYTNGPVLGATSNVADLGTAVTFDGADDHVDLPDMNPDFSNGLAITAWIKPSAAPTTGNYFGLVGISNGQDIDDIRYGWIDGTGMEIYISDTVGGGTQWLDDNSRPHVGEWQHVAVTIDSSGTATMYRNGLQTATGSTSLPATVTRTENFIATSVWSDSFPGDVDDVRIFNRHLCPEEVLEIFGEGAVPGARIIKWVEAP